MVTVKPVWFCIRTSCLFNLILWNSTFLPMWWTFYSRDLFCIIHGFSGWGRIFEFLFFTSMIHWFSISSILSSRGFLFFTFAHSAVVSVFWTIVTLFILSRALIMWLEWFSSTSSTSSTLLLLLTATQVFFIFGSTFFRKCNYTWSWLMNLALSKSFGLGSIVIELKQFSTRTSLRCSDWLKTSVVTWMIGQSNVLKSSVTLYLDILLCHMKLLDNAKKPTTEWHIEVDSCYFCGVK